MVIPTLVSRDPVNRLIRVANLSTEDCFLPARTPVALLHAVEGIDSDEGVYFQAQANELVVSMEPLSATPVAPPPHLTYPSFDGTSSQRQQLQEMLNRRAEGFIKDSSDLGYTDAVYHQVRTTDSVPVAQSYRRIPPHQLREVQDHIKKLLEQEVIVESHSPLRSASGHCTQERWLCPSLR